MQLADFADIILFGAKGARSMLTDEQCLKLEAALRDHVEPRKIAAYLCLHMGLSVAEASALRLRDIDIAARALTVRNALTRMPAKNETGNGSRFRVTPVADERTLPMLAHVQKLIIENVQLYAAPDSFIITGGEAEPGAHLLQNLMASINAKYHIADSLSANMLREAFIRRCIENGVDLYIIGEFVGVKHLQELQRKYIGCLKPDMAMLARLEKYTLGYEPPVCPLSESGKRMNLLILGAGSQGPVVKEIAEAIGVFEKIDYLDDDMDNKLAIDRCENYKKYEEVYPIALPSFGNCPLRAQWIERLEKSGFILPTLVHPMATVSPSAKLAAGNVVEAKAIVGTNARIGKGCILSSGSIIDINASVAEYCHIGAAATVKKNAVVPAYSVIESGDIVDTVR